ncbi:MAG: DUF6734 family protein [Runella sp.]
MKIIQSFWTGLNFSHNIGEKMSLKGSWISSEYHWISWALSCLRLRSYYPNVELITDEVGYEILIKKLNLPYSSVQVRLDEINELAKHLWVLSKIYTYSLQKNSFLHVDSDVFIWKKFPKYFENTPLIVQNIEVNWEAYKETFRNIEKKHPIIVEMMKLKYNNYAYNAGVIGGSNINLFQEYSQTLLSICSQYYKDLKHVPYINMFLEQKYLYQIADKKNTKAITVIKKVIKDPTYKGFACFEGVPYQTKFIHALGDYKKNKDTCRHLARRLRQDYPTYYQRIIEVCRQAGVELDCAYHRQYEPSDYQSHYTHDIRQYRAIQDLFGLPLRQLLSQKLHFSTYVQLIENISSEGVLQQTLLVPDIFTLTDRAISLDALNMVLVDTFLEEPTTISTALDVVSAYFSPQEIASDFQKFQDLALSRIKELMYWGALIKM